MQNKQLKKAQSKTFTIFFFFCGQLLLFQQTLVLMCTNTANVTRASWPNRTAIKGINPQKIMSEPVSGPTFQQWNHHFTKKLCYHCLQPHRHTVGMSFRDAHPSTENNFTKFLNKTEFFTFWHRHGPLNFAELPTPRSPWSSAEHSEVLTLEEMEQGSWTSQRKEFKQKCPSKHKFLQTLILFFRTVQGHSNAACSCGVLCTCDPPGLPHALSLMLHTGVQLAFLDIQVNLFLKSHRWEPGCWFKWETCRFAKSGHGGKKSCFVMPGKCTCGRDEVSREGNMQQNSRKGKWILASELKQTAVLVA